jgi:hypothetical protein
MKSLLTLISQMKNKGGRSRLNEQRDTPENLQMFAHERPEGKFGGE